MKIKVNMSFGEKAVKEELLEIEEHKVEELTEDELREAIEINIREWVNEQIQVVWEVIEEED